MTSPLTQSFLIVDISALVNNWLQTQYNHMLIYSYDYTIPAFHSCQALYKNRPVNESGRYWE